MTIITDELIPEREYLDAKDTLLDEIKEWYDSVFDFKLYIIEPDEKIIQDFLKKVRDYADE